MIPTWVTAYLTRKHPSSPTISSALTLGIVLLFVGTSRTYFTYALKNAYDKDKVIAQMQLMSDEVPTTVHLFPPPGDDKDRSPPTLDRIRRLGVLRVGYDSESLPFAYVNAAGKLVGFDIAMAHKLAAQLEAIGTIPPLASEHEPGDRRRLGHLR